MSGKNDPTIKLFGKTIQLSSKFDEDTPIASMAEPSASADVDSESTSSDQNILCLKQSENRGNEKASIEDPTQVKQEEELSASSVVEESTTNENPKTFSNDKDSSSQDLSKKEDHSDQTSSSLSQDQCPLKKPDKIIPCPRCNSMDTKFCYFNNYNVNQPRHFCKNCQRYWTAGGSMRNVPVGSGRRKSKNSSAASQPHHIMISDTPNGLIHHSMSPNETVLAFGPDSPLPESMASMLKLIEKPTKCVPNGFIELESRNASLDSSSRNENGNSNPTSSKNSIGGDIGKAAPQGLPPQVACISGSPWPYSWSPIPWQSGYPVSFYSPPPYLACNPPGVWNLQWLPTPSICLEQSTTSSSPNSPTLGKHSRDGTMLRPSNNEEPTEEKRPTNTRVVMPKTLRIDDPTEAAKSSIWDTLRIKNDNVSSSINAVGGFFGGFQPSKGTNRENYAEGSTMVLQANPVAFSRSLSFQEHAS